MAVELIIEPPVAPVAPGQSGTSVVRVVNVGHIVESYSLTALAQAAAWAECELVESYGPATLKIMDAAGKVSAFSVGSVEAPTW